MANKSMGQFISALRKANGMTQQDVADKLNVSNKAVSRWERDECAPDISLIPALAEMFGVTCDELLKGERIFGTAFEENTARKTEKQLKTIVNRTLSDFKNMIFTAIAVALVGLVIMFGVSYGAYRPIIGFSVMILFEIAAAGITGIAVSKLKTAKNENELFESITEQLLTRFNKVLGIFSFRSFFIILSAVLLSLPLVIITDHVYVENVLTFKSYIFGCLWFVVLTLVLLHINFKDRFIAKITEQPYSSPEIHSRVKAMSRIQLVLAFLSGVAFFISTYFTDSDLLSYLGLILIFLNIVCFAMSVVKHNECRGLTLLFGIRNLLLNGTSFFGGYVHQMGYVYMAGEDGGEVYHIWNYEYILYTCGIIMLLFSAFGIIKKVIYKNKRSV